MVALAAQHRVPLVPQGGNTGDGRRGDAARGRQRVDPVAAADEPAALDQRRGQSRGRRSRDDPRRPPRPRGRGRAALPADPRLARQLHHRRADRDQRRRHAGAAVRDDAGAGRRGRGGAARRLDPRRPDRAQEGQSRLQPRPIADRLRRHARDHHRGGAAAGAGGRRARGRLGGGRRVRKRRSTCCGVLQGQSDRVEGFEIVPDGSLRLVLEHIPGHPQPARRQASLARADRGDVGGRGRRARRRARAHARRSAGAGADRGRGDRRRAKRRPRPSGACAIRSPKPSEPPAARSPTTFPCRSTTCRASWSPPRPRSSERFPGVEASAFGHLGDGNVHFHVRGVSDPRHCAGDHPHGPRPGHRRGRLDLRRARHRPAQARRARAPRPARPHRRAPRNQARRSTPPG